MEQTKIKPLTQQAFDLAIRVSNFPPDSDHGQKLARNALEAEIALFDEVAISAQLPEWRMRAKATAEYLRTHGRRYTTKPRAEVGVAA